MLRSQFSAEQSVPAHLFPLDKRQNQVDDEHKDEEDKADGDERFLSQSRRITHFLDDLRRHRCDGHEKPRREIVRRVADDHRNSHRLADRSADAENERREDPALCRGQTHLEDRLRLGVSERERALVILVGNRFEAVLGERGDRGHDHERKHEHRRKNALADRNAEHTFQHGNDDDEPEETVHDGRDSGEQVDDLRVRALKLFRAVIHKEYSRTYAEQSPDDDRSQRDDDGRQDHRKNAERRRRGTAPVLVEFRKPLTLEQEVEEADLAQRGNARHEQVDDDGEHRNDGERRRDEKYRLRALLAVQLEGAARFFTANGGISPRNRFLMFLCLFFVK